MHRLKLALAVAILTSITNGQTFTEHRCALLRTPEPIVGYRYLVTGSTSVDRLDVNQLDYRAMSWTEDRLSCNMHATLQTFSTFLLQYLQNLPLIRVSQNRNSNFVINSVQLKSIDAIRINSLLYDFRNGVYSLEFSINRLLASANVSGSSLQVFGVNSVLPDLKVRQVRLRLTVAVSLQQRRGAQVFQVENIAASVLLPYVPRVTGSGDRLQQALYQFVDDIFGGVLDDAMSTLELEPPLLAARAAINKMLENWDVSSAQPEMLRALIDALDHTGAGIPSNNYTPRKNMFKPRGTPDRVLNQNVFTSSKKPRKESMFAEGMFFR